MSCDTQMNKNQAYAVPHASKPTQPNRNTVEAMQPNDSMSLLKTEDKWCTPEELYLNRGQKPHHVDLSRKLKTCRLYRAFGSETPKYCNLDRFSLCTSCFQRLSRQKTENYVRKLCHICREHSLVPVYITVRIPAGPDLGERFTKLESVLQKIRQSRTNYSNGKVQFNEFCRPKHLLWFLEVDRSSNNVDWFPHAHGIALNPVADWKFDLPALRDKWGDFSDSPLQPNVRTSTGIQGIVDSGRYDPTVIATNIRRKICYSLKSSSKHKERLLSVSDRVSAYDALSNRRLVREWSMLS